MINYKVNIVWKDSNMEWHDETKNIITNNINLHLNIIKENIKNLGGKILSLYAY